MGECDGCISPTPILIPIPPGGDGAARRGFGDSALLSKVQRATWGSNFPTIAGAVEPVVIGTLDRRSHGGWRGAAVGAGQGANDGGEPFLSCWWLRRFELRGSCARSILPHSAGELSGGSRVRGWNVPVSVHVPGLQYVRQQLLGADVQQLQSSSCFQQQRDVLQRQSALFRLMLYAW